MRIRTQFAIQLAGGVVNTLVLLALTPILVRTLGLERYGVLLLILGFALYAGLAELGLGMATARYISRAADRREQARIVGASLLVSAPLAILAGALFACLSLPNLGIRLGLNNSVAAELGNARVGLFFFGMSIVICSVFSGVLYGLQRFVTMNLINICSSALYTIGPATYATTLGRDIPGLVLSVAVGQWIVILVSILIFHKMKIYPKLQGVDSALMRRLVNYGGWSTFGGGLHRATNSIDRPFIGALVGAASIPMFAVPQSLINRSNVIVGALTAAVFPRLSQTEGTIAHEGLLRACYRSTCSLAPLYIVGVLALPFFLKFWLGGEFAKAAMNVAILLGLAGWVEAIGAVPYVELLATEKISKESKLASLILFPNVGLLCVGLLYFGVLGAAVVALLRSVAYLVGRIAITGFKAAPLIDICPQSGLVALASIVAIFCPGQRMLGGSLLVGLSLGMIIMRRGPIVDEVIQKFACVRKVPRATP